jgi:hypothetical protein
VGKEPASTIRKSEESPFVDPDPHSISFLLGGALEPYVTVALWTFLAVLAGMVIGIGVTVAVSLRDRDEDREKK